MVAFADDPEFVRDIYLGFKTAIDVDGTEVSVLSDRDETKFSAVAPLASFGVTVYRDGKVRFEACCERWTIATRKVNLATITNFGPFRLTKKYALYSANLFAPSLEYDFHINWFRLPKNDAEVPTLGVEFLSRGSDTEGLSVKTYIEEPSLTCYMYFQYWELDEDDSARHWTGISRRAPLKLLARREEKGEQA